MFVRLRGDNPETHHHNEEVWMPLEDVSNRLPAGRVGDQRKRKRGGGGGHGRTRRGQQSLRPGPARERQVRRLPARDIQ